MFGESIAFTLSLPALMAPYNGLLAKNRRHKVYFKGSDVRTWKVQNARGARSQDNSPTRRAGEEQFWTKFLGHYFAIRTYISTCFHRRRPQHIIKELRVKPETTKLHVQPSKVRPTFQFVLNPPKSADMAHGTGSRFYTQIDRMPIQGHG